jgi:hypothetical protein
MESTHRRHVNGNQPGSSGSMTSREVSLELAHLMAGLERQKEELGPIAEELLELLHQVGVPESRPRGRGFTSSNG